MAVFRVEKNANYSVMANYHFRDKSLSWKAKGILSNMLSLPEDWDYSLVGLTTLASDGQSATRSAIKELEEHGYLIRRPIREKGKISDWEYIIFEYPQSENQNEEIPHVENQQVENSTQLNNNKSTTNQSSIKKSSNNIYSVNSDVVEIFNYWNDQKIIQHRELNDTVEKAILKSIKKYGKENVKEYIRRYSDVVNDKEYYFDYKWSLKDFLNRQGGISDFLDDGSKWVNYQNRNKSQSTYIFNKNNVESRKNKEYEDYMNQLSQIKPD